MATTEEFLVCDYINMDRVGKPILFGVYPRAEMYLVEREPLVVPTLGVLWIIKDLPSPRPSAIVEIKGPLVQEIPARPLEWGASDSGLAPDLGVIVMGVQGIQLTGVDKPIEFVLSLGEDIVLKQNIRLRFWPPAGGEKN